MTLRRYTPLKASRGTMIAERIRLAVTIRDRGCVGPRVGMPGTCAGPIDQDHVRASGGLGIKSESTAANLVSLCRFVHHRMKTDDGRKWRPVLLQWIEEARSAAR